MRKIPSLLKRDVRLIEPDREIFNYNSVFGLGFVLHIQLLENPLGCLWQPFPFEKGDL